MGPMKGYTFSKASGQAVGLTSMALALPVSFPSALPTVSLPFLPSPQTTATASLPAPAHTPESPPRLTPRTAVCKEVHMSSETPLARP